MIEYLILFAAGYAMALLVRHRERSGYYGPRNLSAPPGPDIHPPTAGPIR